MCFAHAHKAFRIRVERVGTATGDAPGTDRLKPEQGQQNYCGFGSMIHVLRAQSWNGYASGCLLPPYAGG